MSNLFNGLVRNLYRLILVSFLLASCNIQSKPNNLNQNTDTSPKKIIISTATPVSTNTPFPEPTTSPTFIPSPTSIPPTPQKEPEILILENNESLINIVSSYPVFDEDIYYPWYRWNGGKILLDPLNIPSGTILKIPNGNEYPPLTHISLDPNEWQYILSSHKTSLNGSSENRLFNIQLAVKRLDGTIIEPYKKFSMLDTIGPTTLENGYKMGFGYANGDEVPMEGGGVCQVPSTLFKTALDAGMLVLERYEHMFYSQRYGPWDATINDDPRLDFTFRNLYDFPVQIRAKINEKDNTLEISIISPYISPYSLIETRVVYNNRNENGIESAVSQKVVFENRVRYREYKSNYRDKP